jgi:hypothetical protein
MGRRVFIFSLLIIGFSIFLTTLLWAAPAKKITRPELKGLSAPMFFPWVGIEFSEALANDAAALKVDMMRVEFIGASDADRPICYAAYDQIVDRAAAREIKILGLLDYQTVASDGQSEWGTEAFRQRFVARIEEIVSHYSSRQNPIRHWEIWNEEDLCVQGFCPRIDPEPYGRILVDAYHAIKAIDPGSTVVLGGISPKGFEYTDNYLQELYTTDAIQAHYSQHGYHPFDVVGCHPYPEIFSAPDPGLANVLNDKIKAVMNANSDSAKKVWLTEMGWNSFYVSERQQADYLSASFRMMDSLSDPANPGLGPYVERYFWFYYRDFGTTDLWGLKTGDLSREKRAYGAYRNLGPSDVVKPIPPPEIPPPGVFGETASDDLALSIQPDTGDPLNGNVATKIWGGFHPANSNSADREPAFTDGAGLGALSGLLMDFPGENVPAWSGFWVLNGGVAVDLTELRVFSGNQGRDGRVFQHYDVFVTADPSPSAASDWTLLMAEVTSAPFWTSNAGGEIGATLTRVTNPAGGALAADITGLQLAFYAVSRTDRVFHDDWDACSGDDRDATDAAFESPLIYEVDAYFGSQPDSTSLHVDSIVLSTANAGKKKKKGRAQATIQDNLGSPVPSAVVTGTFSGDFNETLTATTNSSGVATFTTTRALRAGLSFQFCVDNVSYGMLPYEPQNNLETCDIY